MLDIYLEDNKTSKTYNTLTSFKISIYKFEHLFDKNITDIKNRDIKLCLDKMINSDYKESTINISISNLKTLLRYALLNDFLNELPKLKLDIPKSKPSTKKKLNDSDIEKILNDFKNTTYYTFLCLSVYTGARLGELVGLCWEDIDFNNNTINIHRQWKKNKAGVYDFGKLKSINSYRIIPLNNKLKAILEPLKGSGRVLSNFTNTNSLGINLNAKLKPYNISIHCIRHYFCTKLISNGLDLKSTAYILGHTINMTMKIYSHYNDDMQKKASSIMNDIF